MSTETYRPETATDDSLNEKTKRYAAVGALAVLLYASIESWSLLSGSLEPFTLPGPTLLDGPAWAVMFAVPLSITTAAIAAAVDGAATRLGLDRRYQRAAVYVAVGAAVTPAVFGLTDPLQLRLQFWPFYVFFGATIIATLAGVSAATTDRLLRARPPTWAAVIAAVWLGGLAIPLAVATFA